jgi:hypothetical protein
MTVEQVKRGYANPVEDERRRALNRDPGSATRRAEMAELLEEYSDGARAATSELLAGITAEAESTMPFRDAEGPTGADVAEANDNMSSVMDVAIAGVSAAHAVRAASRQPELPRHSVLVEQAVDAILDPLATTTAEPEDDEPEDTYDASPEDEAADLDAWFASVGAESQSDAEDEPEWAEDEYGEDE